MTEETKNLKIQYLSGKPAGHWILQIFDSFVFFLMKMDVNELLNCQTLYVVLLPMD